MADECAVSGRSNPVLNEGKAAQFGVLLDSYRTFMGTISPPELERSLGSARLRGGLRESAECLPQLRHSLLETGFCAALDSAELVGRLNDAPHEDLLRAGAQFRKCLGLSRGQLQDVQRLGLSPSIAGVVEASLNQLDAVLPAEAVALGPLEGTFRGVRGAIGWLHSDEHRTGEVHLKHGLFPVSLLEVDEESDCASSDSLFEHYHEVKTRLSTLFPELELPAASECPTGGGDDDCDAVHNLDFLSFTRNVISCIMRYNDRLASAGRHEEELVLDVVNVWIPMAEKQIALLPITHCGDVRFKKDTRPSTEEVEEAGYKHDFEAFDKGIAVLFFGRYVLHQAAEGDHFVKCGRGSMESRYLILTTRRSAHRFAICRESCISRPVASIEGTEGGAPKSDDDAVAETAAPGSPPTEGADEASSSAPDSTANLLCTPKLFEEVDEAELGDEPHLMWYQALWST